MRYSLIHIYILKKCIFYQRGKEKKRHEKYAVRYEKCAVLSARCYVDKLYNMRDWNIIKLTVKKAKEK